MNRFRDVAWGVAALLVASAGPAQAAVAPTTAPARTCHHATHHKSCHHPAKKSSPASGGAAPTMPGTQGPITPPSTGHFPQPHPTPGAAAPAGNQKHGTR